MPIAFDSIPQDLRVPLFYAELASGGTPFDSSERLLLIGQKLEAGTAPLDEPILVDNAAFAEEALFGAGSMLAEMVKVARSNAPFQEIWALPVAAPEAATQASATLDYTSLNLPVSTAQTVVAYISGKPYSVVVTEASTAETIADAMAAEINDDGNATFSATAALGVVTVTARHPGSAGNDLDVRVALYGGESMSSLETTVTGFSGGAGDVDLMDGLAALGDEEFLWIASPYSDTASVGLIKAFFDNTSGRWSPIQQLYGHAFMTKYDTVANLSTLGNSHNDEHITIVGVNAMPSAPWAFISAIGARAAANLSDAPNLSRPLQFVELNGIVAPRIADRFNLVDRNTLLYDGIATVRYARTGEVQIERLITTYKTNAAGATDNTFLDVQTLAQAQYILRYLRNKVLGKHSRQALIVDEMIPMDGMARPRDIRNTLIAGYAELMALGVVENQAAFEANLVVERNLIDATRVDVSLPFDAVNQLRVLALRATANLQL